MTKVLLLPKTDHSLDSWILVSQSLVSMETNPVNCYNIYIYLYHRSLVCP